MSDRDRTVDEVPSTKSVLAPSPAYAAELRRRVERGPGATLVAKHLGASRVTIWKLFVDPAHSTIETAERVRQALAELEPHTEPPPPPAVAVIDQLDHNWITAGRELRERDPDRFAEVLAEIQTPGKRRKR